MDIVWMGALAALWVGIGAMVVGLSRLAAPHGREKTSGGART